LKNQIIETKECQPILLKWEERAKNQERTRVGFSFAIGWLEPASIHLSGWMRSSWSLCSVTERNLWV